MTNKSTTCPLCGSSGTKLFFEDHERKYYNCNTCKMIFVPAEFHLIPEEEKKRYDLHENNPEDPEYQKFLNALTEPLSSKLVSGASGLDYGCGPGPAISKMMEDFKVENYDPFYFNERKLLEKKYDFVMCTEVVEHFCNPAKDWEALIKLVKKGGWIGVMTDLVNPSQDFEKWHYRRDPTHVCFYSKETFLWIANLYGLELEFPSKRVVLAH